MPPPKPIDDLVSRLRRSGLIPSGDLEAYLALLPPGATARGLLDQMVGDRLLTPFQAERLGAGKYKGFLLGAYIILDKVGTGGMGQVYLAEHAAMRRLVAVKVLNIPVADDNVAKERFFREARAAAVLNHPNIVRVFDLNKEGQLPYLVMEFVDGIALQSLVTQQGPLSVVAAADYARQIALGLQHAFEKGLVHRDIKPGNLLVERDGTVRILDFGLVRLLDEASTNLTSQLGGRSILGTADYLAPEQAVNSSTVDVRADIYALGATLYFMLAGHPMFPEGRTAQKLMWQQWKEPTPIRELKPEVPPELAAAVHKAIAKKPDERFATPQDLADALAPFATGPNPPPGELIPIPPTRRYVTGNRNIDPTPSGEIRFPAEPRRGSGPRPQPTSQPFPAPPRPSSVIDAPLAPSMLDTPLGTGGTSTTPPPRYGSGAMVPPELLPVLESAPEPPGDPAAAPPGIEWRRRIADPEDVILGSGTFLGTAQQRPSYGGPDSAAPAPASVAPGKVAVPPIVVVLAVLCGAAVTAAVMILSK